MMYLKFCLIQGAYCIGWAGIMQAYLIPLYHDYGYSALQISLLTAIANAVAIVAKPVYGFLCDRMRKTSAILAVAIVVGMVAGGLLAFSRGFLLLTALSVLLLYGTTGALGYLIDAWSVRLQMAGVAVSFGETRACGSLCYAGFSVIFGSLLDRMGFGILVPVYLGISLILLVAVLLVKEPKTAGVMPNREKQSPLPAIRQLLKQPRYVALLVSVFLSFLASYSVAMYLPLRLQELGGGNTHYGIALFVSGAAEVIVLLLYRKLSFRYSHRKLLLLSFVFMLIMVAAVSCAAKPWFAVLMMSTQGVYNGLYMAAVAYYVPELVGLSLSYTGSMIVASMLSVAAVLAGVYMGIMITWIGLQAAMITAIAFAVLSFIVFVGFWKKKT